MITTLNKISNFPLALFCFVLLCFALPIKRVEYVSKTSVHSWELKRNKNVLRMAPLSSNPKDVSPNELYNQIDSLLLQGGLLGYCELWLWEEKTELSNSLLLFVFTNSFQYNITDFSFHLFPVLSHLLYCIIII